MNVQQVPERPSVNPIVSRMQTVRVECQTCGCHHHSIGGSRPPLACGNCGSTSLHPIVENPGVRQAPVYRR